MARDIDQWLPSPWRARIPLLYYSESIWRDGQLVGYVTSGMFGRTVGSATGMDYVNHDNGVNAQLVQSGSYQIEVAAERFPAWASLEPLYGPRNERVKA